MVGFAMKKSNIKTKIEIFRFQKIQTETKSKNWTRFGRFFQFIGFLHTPNWCDFFFLGGENLKDVLL